MRVTPRTDAFGQTLRESDPEFFERPTCRWLVW